MSRTISDIPIGIAPDPTKPRQEDINSSRGSSTSAKPNPKRDWNAPASRSSRTI